MDEIRKSVKKTSENQVDTTREIQFDNSDIFSAKERDYVSYESANYISLVVTDSDNLSLAIGKKGSNIKLAARLTHYKIDVKTYEQASEMGINIHEN